MLWCRVAASKPLRALSGGNFFISNLLAIERPLLSRYRDSAPAATGK
jgi:hypothetical protein